MGINVDPDKILGLDGLAAGEYDLGELLYSTQDGYALQLTGTLVVKSGTQPEPKPEAPATDDKYTATLTSLQKKVVQAWEQSLVNDRDWHIEENRRIQLENNSVKIEPVLFDEVNLQDEETPQSKKSKDKQFNCLSLCFKEGKSFCSKYSRCFIWPSGKYFPYRQRSG